MSRSRSLAVAVATTAALALVPSAASAAALPNAMDGTMRLGKGAKTVTWQVVTVGGALNLRLRVSNVLFPNARLRMTVQPAGGQRTAVINTRTGLNCEGAAGTTFCSVGLDAPAGTYTIRLEKRSVPKLSTRITTAWS